MKVLFRCDNPSKYLGNPCRIIYRSWWEFKYMRELDHDPAVIGWQSEEFYIPYVSPVDRRVHRYFVDFLVKKKIGGKIETYLVEIKPASQTVQPKRGNKRLKTFHNEALTYGKNIAKWQAAREYAARRGWHFQILTEKELKIA